MPSPSPSTPATSPSIRIEALHHGFDGKKVIGGLDLEIPSGEFLVILGASGCGKSTLLRLIAGLITPLEGQIHLDPSDPGIGFVFQDASLLPWRTALDNVRLPLELLNVPSEIALKESQSLLRDVGLEDVMHCYPDALSGGMRMRVSIARALAGHPRLLLLDEPFAALDEVTRTRLDHHLGLLARQRGMTTLFVTHSISEALTIADRIIVIGGEEGQIVHDETLSHPWPRDPSVRLGSEAQALAQRLSHHLERKALPT